MKADVVKIGNSKGIRIPKPILEACGFGTVVRLDVVNHQLIISADNELRKGWEESFQTHAGNILNDPLLLPEFANEFDHEEWEWT